jgi:hypothetical protein
MKTRVFVLVLALTARLTQEHETAEHVRGLSS